MPMGPGKYDDLATKVREESGGSVLLIILDGNKGDGFAMQADVLTMLKTPEILRSVIKHIEESTPSLTAMVTGGVTD